MTAEPYSPIAVQDAVTQQARIQDFLQGGGGQRRPCTAGAFSARADGGSRVDKHQIKVHIASIEYSKRFFLFVFLL